MWRRYSHGHHYYHYPHLCSASSPFPFSSIPLSRLLPRRILLVLRQVGSVVPLPSSSFCFCFLFFFLLLLLLLHTFHSTAFTLRLDRLSYHIYPGRSLIGSLSKNVYFGNHAVCQIILFPSRKLTSLSLIIFSRIFLPLLSGYQSLAGYFRGTILFIIYN